MSLLHNPYGDGKSCNRIVDFIKELNDSLCENQFERK